MKTLKRKPIHMEVVMKRKNILAALVAAVLVVLLGGFTTPAFAGNAMKKYMSSPDKDSDIASFLKRPDKGMLQIMKGTCGTAHGGTPLYSVCMAALNEAIKGRTSNWAACPGSHKWVAKGNEGASNCKCPEGTEAKIVPHPKKRGKKLPICATGISDKCFAKHDGELVGKCDCPKDTPVLNKEQFACEACPKETPVWNAEKGICEPEAVKTKWCASLKKDIPEDKDCPPVVAVAKKSDPEPESETVWSPIYGEVSEGSWEAEFTDCPAYSGATLQDEVFQPRCVCNSDPDEQLSGAHLVCSTWFERHPGWGWALLIGIPLSLLVLILSIFWFFLKRKIEERDRMVMLGDSDEVQASQALRQVFHVVKQSAEGDLEELRKLQGTGAMDEDLLQLQIQSREREVRRHEEVIDQLMDAEASMTTEGSE